MQDLLQRSFCNPHSEHGWSEGASVAATERLRQLTLGMCSARQEDYVCVLTSGATAAIKLVADTFPWSDKSAFLHLSDNHNSVLGVREVACGRGAAAGSVPAATIDLGTGVQAEGANVAAEEGASAAHHLFAFPLESNLHGVRYSERLTSAVQSGDAAFAPDAITWYVQGDGTGAGLEPGTLPRGRWYVLLDAAKACGTRPPDLSTTKPDFVALSYYKIFGAPTGLGALLVRRDALGHLKKSYFGGGTVLTSVAEARFHVVRPGAAGLEDGTLPFLSIPVAVRGFQWLEQLGGHAAVEKTAMVAASRLAERLSALRHSNGTPACIIHGGWLKQRDVGGTSNGRCGVAVGQGPVVAFSVVGPDGGWVGHRVVERTATVEGVVLRTGAVCNPGALREALGVDVEGKKAQREASAHHSKC